jgi:SAM-dependent methyltransferase
VDFGELDRVEPFSPEWGCDRGQALDRFYIESFLERQRADIHGAVLEVKELEYAERFGAPPSSVDILDLDRGNPRATVIGDLTRPESLPSERFDCFLCTQTLHVIYDVRAALVGCHRLLKRGGVLLATLPALGRTTYEDGGLEGGDYWRFTLPAVRRLFAEVFSAADVHIDSHGNVQAATAFLYGLNPDELSPEALHRSDPYHPVLFTVRAVRRT